MPLEIKANNWYRTRGGEIAYVFGINPYPAEGEESLWASFKSGFVNCWFLDGTNSAGQLNDEDLVEHLPDCDGFDWVPKPKIQLEAGKRYVMANGFRTEPLCKSDADVFAWYDPVLSIVWNIDGVRLKPSVRATENIVAEYIEPEPTYEPWDFESMPVAVKVKHKPDGIVNLALPFNAETCQISNMTFYYSELFRMFEQLDNTPCGKVKQ